MQTGSEAARYAMSDVKFDIIMMEFKLPQVNGADVARMIRETKNANAHTPIVAVTGYLKELQAPHDFDALVEKPPDTQKLTEVMSRLCQWKPPPPGWTPAQMGMPPPSNLRMASVASEDSPTSTNTSMGVFSSTGLELSREDSVTSGSIGETESHRDSIPVIISRTGTSDWSESELERNFGGLGISGDSPRQRVRSEKLLAPRIPSLKHEPASAPEKLESTRKTSPKRAVTEITSAGKRRSSDLRQQESAEAGDDEDEELGHAQIGGRSPTRKPQGSSKLGQEVMRTNSQGSIVSPEESDHMQILETAVLSPLPLAAEPGSLPTALDLETKGHLTPPQMFPQEPGHDSKDIDMDATPKPRPGEYDIYQDPEQTPRRGPSPPA